MKKFSLLAATCLIALVCALPASAAITMISSFENRLNDWSIPSGTNPSDVRVVDLFRAHKVDIVPTSGWNEGVIFAGSTPFGTSGTDFASIINLKDKVHVNAGQYIFVDVNLVGEQPRPDVDWIGISINGIAYRIIDTMAMPTLQSSGWKTFGLQFTNEGSFDLGLLCVNGGNRAAPSSCVVDNFRKSDDLPSPYSETYIPLIGTPTRVTLTPAIPEPETYALFIAGIGLIGAVARRRCPPS